MVSKSESRCCDITFFVRSWSKRKWPLMLRNSCYQRIIEEIENDGDDTTNALTSDRKGKLEGPRC